MRQIPLRFWVLASVLILINVAGWLFIGRQLWSTPLRTLRLLSVSPANQVDETDRFVLVFDGPVTREDLCNAPLEYAPFEIQPRPAGHWRWSQPDQLVYLLDEKLPAGNEFVIRPAADFQTQTRRTLIGDSASRKWGKGSGSGDRGCGAIPRRLADSPSGLGI